ncbi:MAG TPA: alpha/beta hydrolase [Roseiflexaceae bacterium]|nr:alpha/beta hydrolase [Roseiflexaceae bacterium]
MVEHTEQYRQAEARLWTTLLGALPAEHALELPNLHTRVRALVVGQGPTLLFVHGGPNAASTWAPLVRLLPDFRCVLLERPGCGLSPLPRNPPRPVRRYAAQLIGGGLAALDEQPAAIVASSFGSYCALTWALAHPAQAGRMVHLGCPALVPGQRIPLPMLLPIIPGLGALMRALEPATPVATWRSFQRMGHAAPTLRRPEVAALLVWYTTLMRYTPTQANDQKLFGDVRPGDALTTHELARLPVPMSFFWGEADTFGGAHVARALVAHIPNATLEFLVGGGHLPWLDAPERAAAHIRAFMEGQAIQAYTCDTPFENTEGPHNAIFPLDTCAAAGAEVGAQAPQ